MCYLNFHVQVNYLGSSLEGRFVFSISKKLHRDAKDAGPHFLGIKRTHESDPFKWWQVIAVRQSCWLTKAPLA